MATYDLVTTTPSKISTGDILNCPYSGVKKSITLPAGTYKLEVWGAQGGYRSNSSYGGMGGYSVGTITLANETTVYLYSGGAGNSSGTNSTVFPGGFNGGGYRYGYRGGGGASDIRIGTDSLYARVIVAGGGGSDGAPSKTGMYGGGTEGGSSTEFFGSYGYGGTQTGNAGNLITTTQPTTNSSSSSSCYSGFGFGGMGTYYSSGYAGAGGGGWYGGTGSYPDGSGDDDRGGGGGSGYVYTSSTASNYPSGCLLNSSHYLADAATYAGNTSFTSPSGSSETGHPGDGYCRITVINIPITLTYNINGGTSSTPSSQVVDSNNQVTITSVTPTKNSTSGTYNITFYQPTEIYGLATEILSTATQTYTQPYSFKEWNTSPNGTGTKYTPNQTITLTSNMTLYAIFTAGTKSLSSSFTYPLETKTVSEPNAISLINNNTLYNKITYNAQNTYKTVTWTTLSNTFVGTGGNYENNLLDSLGTNIKLIPQCSFSTSTTVNLPSPTASNFLGWKDIKTNTIYNGTYTPQKTTTFLYAVYDYYNAFIYQNGWVACDDAFIYQDGWKQQKINIY